MIETTKRNNINNLSNHITQEENNLKSEREYLRNVITKNNKLWTK